MSSIFRILVACTIVVAFGAVSVQAQDEKSSKEKPTAVKKASETPTKEKPAKEKPEAVKKEGEKPTKGQPAKEKPEATKSQPEKPTKEQPAKEKPQAVKKEGEKPSKEQPAKEKPESVKKPETPTKEQPAKEKPEAVKKQPEKPTTEKPGQEKKPEKPVEKKPEAQKKPQAKTDAKEGTLIEAVVKSVNTDKNAITVVLRKNEEKVEQTFTVEKDARFLVSGNKAASLSDVKPEMRVVLMLTEQKTVAGIRSGEGGRKGQSANGIVKAVDEGKNSITITVSKEGRTADQTFAVAKDAKIAVAGGEGKISDLKPGTRVAFMVAEDKNAVVAIKAVPKGEKAPEKKKEGSPKK